MVPDHHTEEELHDAIKLNVPRYIAWMIYDMANTFYASGILTLMAATWFLVRIQQAGQNYGYANSVFNLTLLLGVDMPCDSQEFPQFDSCILGRKS